MAEKHRNRTTNHIGIGLCLGLVVGIAMDNIPVGLCLGIALGTALHRRHQEPAA